MILHAKGDRMPVELLAGLEVRLNFERCELAGHVYRLMSNRSVIPASCSTWCHCAQQLVAAVAACDRMAALADWGTPDAA